MARVSEGDTVRIDHPCKDWSESWRKALKGKVGVVIEVLDSEDGDEDITVNLEDGGNILDFYFSEVTKL